MKNIFKIALLFSLFCSFTAFALPNPAAKNCTANHNKYLMIKWTGFCVFSNGSYCEEWQYYKGTCKPGMNTLPGGKFKSSYSKKYCLSRSKKVVLCH